MNTLKYIIAVVLLCSFYQGYGQHKNINYLTIDEFNDIKINGVRLGAIRATKGDRSRMKSLFGSHIEIIEDDMAMDWMIHFLDRAIGLGISFVDNGLGSEKDYILYSFDLDRSSKITIKGITVGVGDPVRKLGNVKPINNRIYFDSRGGGLVV